MKEIVLTVKLLKIFAIYYFCDLATNEKYSNCNSFGVTMDLLNAKNFKVAITQLSNVQ